MAPNVTIYAPSWLEYIVQKLRDAGEAVESLYIYPQPRPRGYVNWEAIGAAVWRVYKPGAWEYNRGMRRLRLLHTRPGGDVELQEIFLLRHDFEIRQGIEALPDPPLDERERSGPMTPECAAIMLAVAQAAQGDNSTGLRPVLVPDPTAEFGFRVADGLGMGWDPNGRCS